MESVCVPNRVSVRIVTAAETISPSEADLSPFKISVTQAEPLCL